MSNTVKKESSEEASTSSTDTQILDNLFGPLELALDHSNRQMKLDHMPADPTYNLPNHTCEYCSKSFPITTWYFDVHIQECKKKPAATADLPEEMNCPQCDVTLPGGKLLAHLAGAGTPKCTEFWRGLTVVEKKAVFPDYEVEGYEVQLSEGRAHETLASLEEGKEEYRADGTGKHQVCKFCPHCGTSVFKEDWFWKQHLSGCHAKKERAGNLYRFSVATGLRHLP